MANPDIKDLVSSTEVGSFTAAEEADFRSIDTEQAATLAGQEVIQVVGESMTVDELGRKIYDLAQQQGMTDLSDKTHADVKIFLKNNESAIGPIDKSDRAALLQLACMAGPDGKWGIGSMQALLAKYTQTNKPTQQQEPEAPATEEEHGTVIDIKDIPYDTIKEMLSDTNLNRPGIVNCDACLAKGQKDGYIVNGYIPKAKISYTRQDSTISISGSGLDSIPIGDLFTRDVNGDGKKVLGQKFAERVISAISVKANKEGEEKMTESINEAVHLRNKYNTIRDLSHKIMTTFNAEKIGGIMASYNIDQSKYMSLSQMHRNSITKTETDLKLEKTKLTELQTSVDKIPLDTNMIKTSLTKDITAQIAKIDKEIGKTQRLGKFIDISGQDKRDVGVRETYVNRQSHESLLKDPRIITDTEALIKRLEKNKNTVALANDNDWGKTFAQQAYNEGITRLNNAIEGVKVKITQAKRIIGSIQA